MTLSELLQNRFRADLRHRGAAYIEAERVSLVRVTAENVFGMVVDGVEYNTQLRHQESDIALFCTCDQFAKSGACKHLWATVLAADLEGHVHPSLRPGRLVPFVVRESSLPVTIDDLTSEFEPDSETDRSNGRAAKAVAKRTEPRLKRWESRLSELQDEISAEGKGGKTQSSDRQIYYQIDLEGSRDAGKLVIQASQRQRRSSGQWGKLKPLKIRPGQLDQIEHEDDRIFLSYLSGAIPERNNWSTQQAELQAAAHRFHLPYELGRLILPEMCRSGRLTLLDADNSGSQTLEWDSAEPWELTIRIRRDTDVEGWSVHAQLIREEETLELVDVPLAVAGGFVVTADSIGQLRDFGAPQWMTMLAAEGRLAIPVADEDQFVDRLLDIPSLPRLELPKELQLEEVRTKPAPQLKIFTPPASRWRSEALTAEVLFEYLGTPVPGRNARWAVVQREENRCIIRDRGFEAECWQQLRELGFRKRLNGSQTNADVEIFRRDIASAVRHLVEHGWEVFADGSQVRQPGSMKFRVQSDVDWFDVHADVDFEGHRVAFPELLQALERGDSIVRLDDGSLGILPEHWLEQIGMISGLGTPDQELLRFSNSQAALLDALLSAQEHVEFDERFQDLRTRFQSISGVEAVDVPKNFKGVLRDYQRDGLSWMCFLRDFGLGGCLADDMGLGKTVQFIAMLLEHRTKSAKIQPSLVVVPRSLMFNWHSECEKFAPELKVLDYTGMERTGLRSEFEEHDVILTTYGTVRRDIAVLKDIKFAYVVLDEAQTIKNPSSQIARASRLLNARHRLALSGTPIENNAGDLWSIFEFLNPGMLGRSTVFRSHVADPDSRDTRDVVARGLRPFILRRTKKQVAAELPDRLEETILCDMDNKQRRLYDELRIHYRDSLLGLVEDKGLARSKMHVLEALLRLRQAACHPALLDRGEQSDPYAKLEFLIPHLRELVAENHKSLVFSQFTSMLAIVRHHLDEAGIEYEYLDGQTRDRKAHVTRFQEDDDCRIFLISLKAGGLGLNLTAAEYVFLLDPWWNPAVEAQAIDRAHRVGQTKTVFAYRMICRDTVEEKILQLQKQKRELADAILAGDSKGSILSEMSLDDLELLLS
ncbi:MAG: SNF2 family helicase [Fuerstiella sp.]|nr:SNF2 family helicase [Fuerstiella sp.]